MSVTRGEAESPVLTEHTVAEAARGARLPGQVHFRPVTGSTNSDLVHMGLGGAPEWTVVVAARQEDGRGRMGRKWWSPPGESLAVSVLLRPPLDPAKATTLSMLSCVAASDACRSAAKLEVSCKWPNDLMCSGRKLGGVLPESRIEDGRLGFTVIGFGANVSQRTEDFPTELRATATSVKMEGGRADGPAILAAYLSRLADLYVPSRVGWIEAALAAYADRCQTIGSRVRASTTAGGLVEGKATGLGPSGELLVQTSAGEETVAFGEVEHLG